LLSDMGSVTLLLTAVFLFFYSFILAKRTAV